MLIGINCYAGYDHDDVALFLAEIRYPEEVSLARKLEREELKKNRGASATRRTRVSGLLSPNASNGHDGTLSGSPRSPLCNTPPTVSQQLCDAFPPFY
jgi:hypothetical protein